MKLSEGLKWNTFTKSKKTKNLAKHEARLCAAAVSLEVMREQGWKNAAKLPDDIEAVDCLWIDTYVLRDAIENLATASAIDIDSREMQAVRTFLIENHNKTYNEILDKIPVELGDDALTNRIKQFLPSLVLHLKLAALEEHIEGLYGVRDVEDIKDSVKEDFPDQLRRMLKLIRATREEATRLFGLFMEASGKLYFVDGKE